MSDDNDDCGGFDCAGLDSGNGPTADPHASTRCGEYDHFCTCGLPYSAHEAKP